MLEAAEFCKRVEKLIIDNKFDSYIDAVLHVCEQESMEPFMGARMISKPIKEKIKEEGQQINLLPSKTRLPIK